jgi:cyclopropane-fatty-acyl-phospholipid synthase
MRLLDPKRTIEKLLKHADIAIGGERPWDIRVSDERFYGSVVRGGGFALGESYMAGWWDVDELDSFVARLLETEAHKSITITPGLVLLYLSATLRNRASSSRSFEVARRHYDVGNDLFLRMLDKRMVYTCGYWRDAKNLDEAQEAKLDLVCRKLGLQPGEHVLDIGCGWGSFGKFAAEKYGVRVTGVTISKEQIKLGEELCKGLPVAFILEDYRKISGTFDHIVSLGMFEHVGYKNYRQFFEIVRDHLKDKGLFLLHTLGENVSRVVGDRWMDKYIFPNGMVPSIAQIGKALEGIFVMEDWHNFGADYEKTLHAWFANFDRHWPELRDAYGDTFYRMWKYYLLSCAGVLRAREMNLWQIVLSKRGVPGGYRSVR